MEFFRGLGLKTIVHEEFIKFCTETAEGQVTDVREALSVLIDSLFKSKQEWHAWSPSIPDKSVKDWVSLF